MNEFDIQQVMQQFGMDYIQARNHLICQASLRTGAKPFAIVPATHSPTVQAAANVRQLSDYRTVDGSRPDTKT